jgi:hypothetical protein
LAIATEDAYAENELLRLDAEKARQQLGWTVTLDLEATMTFVAQWYKRFYEGAHRSELLELSHQQMATFVEMAQARGLAWA